MRGSELKYRGKLGLVLHEHLISRRRHVYASLSIKALAERKPDLDAGVRDSAKAGFGDHRTALSHAAW